MIIIGNTTVSNDLYLVSFCCHLEKCLGACCVAGDAGAPLEEEEISLLEDELDRITPYMTARGIQTVKDLGVFDYDVHGKFVTPLVNGGECAFAIFNEGKAYCAIEKAYFDHKTPFRKPVSCHLYPVRIKIHENFEAVNYEKWHVCKPALKKRNRDGVPLYQFLKEALVRKYGTEWYQSLEQEIASRQSVPDGNRS
ncbi:MAG: DUF3109 family protein [Bacteroidales bacterium]|nr:DUF3109 family protein [Bacteroidales bacterium]